MRLRLRYVQFAQETVERELGAFGVEFVDLGTPPWTLEEDMLQNAEVLSHALNAIV